MLSDRVIALLRKRAESEFVEPDLREKDKKRHCRDGEGGESRHSNHHSKKLKGLVVVDKGDTGVILPSQGDEVNAGVLGSVVKPTQEISGSEPLMIRVEANERWTVEDKQPLQVFDGFTLPQDSEHYVDGSLGDRVLRSKKLLGEFISDFTRIVSAYKEDGNTISQIRRELSEAKDDWAEAEKKVSDFAEKERQASERVAALQVESAKWDAEKTSLMTALKEQKTEVRKMRAALSYMNRNDTKMKKDHDVIVGQFAQEKVALIRKLESVKNELSLSQEEVVRSLKEGYEICWNRASDAGYEMDEHTFAKYSQGLAEPLARDEGCSSNRSIYDSI